jgi:hypothetical protein
MSKVFMRYLLIPHLMAAILSLGCLVGFAIYYNITHAAPSQKHHATLVIENRNAKATLLDVRTRVKSAQQAVETSEQLTNLDHKIADAPNQAVLVAEINTFVRRSNVIILHGDNRIATDADGVVWFHQELTVEGKYQNIRYFLELLSGSKRLNIVQEVSWKPASKGQQKARVKLATMFRGN